MADMQDLDDLEFLLRRRGNAMVHQQAQFVQNTIDWDLPVGEEDAQPPEEGVKRPIKVNRDEPGVDVVNVQKGGTSGAGAYADGTPRPTGGGRPKHQGRAKPVMFSALVQFNLGEIDIANGSGDGIDAHLNTVRAHGSMVGALLARSVNNPQVAEPAADVLATVTSITVPEMNGYIEGASYDVVVDATGVLIGTFEADTVAGAFDGSAVISFPNGATLGFAIDVSEQSIYLRGQGDEDLRYGNLADFTDDTVDLYGLTTATQFPAGIEEDLSGPWENATGKNAVSILTPFCKPKAWLTTPLDRDKIVNAQEDNVRFLVGMGSSKGDPFKDFMIPEFAGLPVIACPQAVSGDVVLGDFDMCELREHVPYAPQKAQGIGAGDWGKASLLPSELLHAYKMPCRGWYRFITPMRRAFLRITNVTA